MMALRLQKQMLKEDKELGLHLDSQQVAEEEDVTEDDAFDIAVEQKAETEQEDIPDLSDTESIEAALAEIAINESTEEPTQQAAKAEELSIPVTRREQDIGDGHVSPEEINEEPASKSNEPQMSKRDKRRAREARKKAELEAAADMPVKEVRQERGKRNTKRRANLSSRSSSATCARTSSDPGPS
jgi:hypothetical protein